MPPEKPPYLVILDTFFPDGHLVGRAEYIVEADPEHTLSVRWGIGSPPPGYKEEGGGVVFVAHQSPAPPPPDENAAIKAEGKLSYSYQEGLGGAPWLMLVMILPSGHALGEATPPPDGSRLFGDDRLAYYWRLTSPPVEARFVRLQWSLRPTSDVGKALAAESESPAPIPFDASEVPEFGVFVSYRRDDSRWAAGRIKDWISRALGERSVFRDSDSIRAGKDFRRVIDDAVGQCKVMLALIGPRWLRLSDAEGRRRIDSETDWVRIEIESALQRHRVVIPVLLDDAKVPEETSLPESLRQLAFLHAYTLRETTFERDVGGLIEQLRAHVSEANKASTN